MRHAQQKQQERQQQEIKDYNRLARAKAEKPYHIRYYWLYIFLIVLGWVANLVSGVTESSKIYSFFHDFLDNFSNGTTLAWGMVLVSVVLLELLNRFLAQNYFREFVENDGHETSMTWNLLAMLLVSTFSLLLSFTGGFDLVRLTNEKPDAVIPEKVEIEDVQTAYTPLISELKNDISEYKSTREWRGRLSDKSAKQWEDMKEKKQEIQAQMAGALQNLSLVNLESQVRADSLNQQLSTRYETEVNDRGYGLGFVTLFFIALMYFCIWYKEQYTENKAKYLEAKYGKMEDGHILSLEANATPLPSDGSAKLEALEQQIASLTQILAQPPRTRTVDEVATTGAGIVKPHLNGSVKKN